MPEKTVFILEEYPENIKNQIESLLAKGIIKGKKAVLRKKQKRPIENSSKLSPHNFINNPPFMDLDQSDFISQENSGKSFNQFMMALIDTIRSPIFYKNLSGEYMGCNRAFGEIILGVAREEITGKKVLEFSDIITPEAAEKDNSQDIELIRNPGAVEYEETILCASGEYRQFHISRSTFPGPDGKIAGTVGVMVDITERVKSERELRRINEEMNLLINSLPSIIIGVSVKDRITHFNPFAEKIFGIKKSDILGRAFHESSIKWDWDIIYESISQCILDEKTIWVNDLHFIKNDGKKGVLGLTINPLQRENLILEGFIIIGKDLTEQRILEAQLLQSNKLEALGQLAAGVAHEINSPLQYVGDNLRFLNKTMVGLLNLLDIYQRGFEISGDKNEFNKIRINAEEQSGAINLPFLIEEVPKALDQTLEGVNRISVIVQSMKAFSHPGSGTMILTDINRAIENTINVSRNEWKYHCDLNFIPDSEIPMIPCLESEFNQVILNLIVNAADAIKDSGRNSAEEKGLITIETSLDENYIKISIKDNGPGIPEEIQNRVFDPFFTTKEVGKGTGQGLPISHTIIVEKHKGLFYFETEPGKGTSFIIKLPVNGE